MKKFNLTEDKKRVAIEGVALARFALSKCWKCWGCMKCGDLYFAGDNNCSHYRSEKEKDDV